MSYGGLTKPSELVLQWTKRMDKVFVAVHGETFGDRTFIRKKLIQTLEENCIDIPIEVIRLFAKTRIYMRCKYLNKLKVEQALIKKIEKRAQKALKRCADPLNNETSRSSIKKMKKITS